MEIYRNYTGCPPERMDRYRSWRNTDDTCGAYAAAVMLAYYQDYLDGGILRNSVRKEEESDAGPFLQLVKNCMGGGTRTIPPDVRRAVNRVLRLGTPGNVRGRYRAAMWIGFCGSRIERELKAGRPCCIGMLRLTGSSYGNHWVTAYGYEDTPEGRVYIAHDNWGNPRARIPAKWINSMVYLKKE